MTLHYAFTAHRAFCGARLDYGNLGGPADALLHFYNLRPEIICPDCLALAAARAAAN